MGGPVDPPKIESYLHGNQALIYKLMDNPLILHINSQTSRSIDSLVNKSD